MFWGNFVGVFLDILDMELKRGKKNKGEGGTSGGQRHARGAKLGSGRSAVQTCVSCASIEMQIPLSHLIMGAVKCMRVCMHVCVFACVCVGGCVSEMDCEWTGKLMQHRFSHIC